MRDSEKGMSKPASSKKVRTGRKGKRREDSIG